MQTILALTAAAAYLISVGFYVGFSQKPGGSMMKLLASIAAIAHFALLWQHPEIGPWWVMCGITLVMVMVYFLSVHHASRRLGLIVLLSAGASLLLLSLFGGGTAASADAPPKLHLMLAVIAYAFLALSFAQSCIYIWQEKLTRANPLSSELEHMPALETSENLLFWFVRIGFAILSIVLLTGIYFASSGSSPMPFTHHTVLSILSWICFALLLGGHHFRGWRGQHAAKWTVTGFAVLALAYFGTRFVTGVLLA